MEKEDIILLLLIIGSIITLIFGIYVLNLGNLVLAELGGGAIAMMAMGVIMITTIVFPIVIIILNILALKILDDNKTIGIVFGYITLALCVITLLFCIFYIIIIGVLPEEVADIVARIRGSLVVCIIGQIIVLVGAILNLSYQSSK